MFEDVEEFVPDEENDKKFIYRYNREERIAKAPQLVKDYYAGKLKPVRGFRIFLTKQNRYIFFALIFFVGATWIYTGLNRTRSGTTLAGVNFELSAYSYEEEVYVSLQMQRSSRSKETAPLAVEAEFFAIDPNNQVGDKVSGQLVYEEGQQYIRTKFTDYDIIRVDVILNAGGSEKELSAEVKR